MRELWPKNQNEAELGFFKGWRMQLTSWQGAARAAHELARGCACGRISHLSTAYEGASNLRLT